MARWCRGKKYGPHDRDVVGTNKWGRCSECLRGAQRVYDEAHREERRAYDAARREERRAYNRRYYEGHREERRASDRRYYEEHWFQRNQQVSDYYDRIGWVKKKRRNLEAKKAKLGS